MLAEFCVRLAFGLTGSMAITTHPDVDQGFFRNHLLVVLGLLVLGSVAGPPASRLVLWVGCGLSWLGFVQWSLGWRGAGRVTLGLIAGTGLIALVVGFGGDWTTHHLLAALRAAAMLSSSAVCGTVLAAMLLGHWYLVTPAMAMAPLQRLIRGLFCALALRGVLAVFGVAASLHPESFGAVASAERDSFWWSCVAARFLLGLVAPACLAWLVWRTTQIRATQSATGILYATLILAVFGELVALAIEQRAATLL